MTTETKNDPNQLLTVADVMALAGLSRGGVYLQRLNGTLPPTSPAIRNRVLWRRGDLDQYLKARKAGASK